MFLSLFS